LYNVGKNVKQGGVMVAIKELMSTLKWFSFIYFSFFLSRIYFENLQIEEFDAGSSWKFFGFLLDLNDCISLTDYFGAVLVGYLMSFKSDALFKYFFASIFC
jgi:hypothetical protein